MAVVSLSSSHLKLILCHHLNVISSRLIISGLARRSAKAEIMLHQAPLRFSTIMNEQLEFKNPSILPSCLVNRNSMRACHIMEKNPCIISIGVSCFYRKQQLAQYRQVKCMVGESLEEILDDDEELCPVECVREIKKDEELLAVLEKSKRTNALVVVDFYRTSCGSCKYIEQGFAKLCKGLGDEEAPVIFLKHNVIDEYDEQSEIAERLRIKSVPLFHFYKDGTLVEAFPTRDKERIKAAILKYTASAAPNL